MSAAANVDLVHRVYQTWTNGPGGWPDVFAPDFEWDTTNLTGWPDTALFRGHAGLEQMWNLWGESWEEYRVEVLELQAVGDETVFSVARQVGRGKLSGAAVEMTFAGITTVRDGRLVRYEQWTDVEAARRAAGLSEELGSGS